MIAVTTVHMIAVTTALMTALMTGAMIVATTAVTTGEMTGEMTAVTTVHMIAVMIAQPTAAMIVAMTDAMTDAITAKASGQTVTGGRSRAITAVTMRLPARDRARLLAATPARPLAVKRCRAERRLAPAANT